MSIEFCEWLSDVLVAHLTYRTEGIFCTCLLNDDQILFLCLQREASRDTAKFDSFLNDFGLYLKEGLITEPEHETREQIARLLRWESSNLPSGEKTTLDDYVNRMTAGERSIYFLSAPSRQLAESSPYLEAVRKKSKNTEVRILFICLLTIVL